MWQPAWCLSFRLTLSNGQTLFRSLTNSFIVGAQMCLVLHRAKQVMFQIASNTSGGSRTGTPQVHLPTESDELEERPGALHPALMTLGSFRVLAQVTHHTSATCCIRSLRPLACRPRVFHPWQKLRANPTSFHAPASTMSPEPN